MSLYERSTNEKERKQKIYRITKQTDDDKNPCVKEQAQSYNCLSENGYDKEKCSLHFQNYKNCKEFWYLVTKDRKKNGVTPELPPSAERDRIRKEYKHFMGF